MGIQIFRSGIEGLELGVTYKDGYKAYFLTRRGM